MSSKGYIRISESQLCLERSKRIKNKTWHQHMMNLLYGKNVCGSCLRVEEELVNWDTEFVLLLDDDDVESSLKNIMISTFGPSVTNIIPTSNFCQKCVDAILSAHLLVLQLRNNCNEIQRKLTEISQQMKWTNYLDETGSLVDVINNKNLDDDNSKTAPNNVKDSNDLEKYIKTHKIILNDESLTTRFLKEPAMHKFLFMSKKEVEPKLPEGITVKKVTKSEDNVDSDFAPHDLLELNWDGDEDEPKMTAHVPDKKLQSNEALIMNLMEEAKTVEKHKHFHDNLKLQVNHGPRLEQSLKKFNDSLSVKLIQKDMSQAVEASECYSDNEELVPQDLLELKWPEEQCNTAQQTKIPVKKLNFNAALTVKYIPSHKLRRVEHSANEMAPHELLELNWNEETQVKHTSAPQTDQKHSIDLKQWLQDQGMSIIKTKETPAKTSSHNLNNETEAPRAKKMKLSNNNLKEVSENINQDQTVGTEHKSKINDSNNSNITVTDLEAAVESDDNAIRCALCDLSFIQYESYSSHYKTHKITESAKCYRCSGKFPVIELLVEHLLLLHSEDMAYCTLCYALLDQKKVVKHMVDYHAKKVEVINAASTMLSKEGRCKKCNQHFNASSDTPHICVFRLDCTECTEDCIHEKYLKSYIEQIKANKIVFKCPDCAYQYKTKQDIVKHANYMHLKHKSNQCVVCRDKFSTQFELTKHNHSRHFPCGRCKKVFADKEILQCHSCPKQAWTNLSCESCGQKFISRKTYDYHKNTAMVVGRECSLCHDKVPERCNMARHMQVVHQVSLKKTHESILYECIICRKMYKTETDFKQHGCLYECQICGKRFNNTILYEKHLRAHKGVGAALSLKCSICNLQSTSAVALSQHMATHSNHRKCTICYNYIEQKFLTQHMASHEERSKTLKCPHCALVCESRNHFEVHVNRFHLMQRPYQCDMCKKSYYSKYKLREHIRSHTSETRKETCPLCNKKFARKHTLDKHIKLHSSGQLYNCDLCDKMYISEALLNQHRLTHRGESDFPKAETSRKSQK